MNPGRWQKVNELFHAAIEQDGPARRTFLADACGADASLLSEVEKLVAAHDRAGGFLQGGAFEAATQLLAASEEAAVTGERFGAYRIIREIGRGGMGAVYLADRADEQFEKRVAIKVVKRGMDTDFVLQRFRNERHILASLDCPNVARLLDAGTTEAGTSYFVMEYIDGQPIDHYCDLHRLSVTARLKLFMQVCSAVSCAHQRQVVHRDIKPENILITGQGVPKLLDFGIAKILDNRTGGQTLWTAAGWRPMTPEYASPEQVRGEPVTTASDVYSLGVVLYELLTGQLPYRLRSHSLEEMERLISKAEPEKPSMAFGRVTSKPDNNAATRDAHALEVSERRDTRPDKLRRRLAGDLDTIVLTALRKEPERRYASVDEFSEDLRRHVERLPVLARKDTLAYRIARFIRGNRASVIAAALFSVVFIAVSWVGLWVVPWPRNRLETAEHRQPRRLAVVPFINLRPAAETDFLSYSMAEVVSARLSHVGTLSVTPASAMYNNRTAAADPLSAASMLKADTVLVGHYLKEGNLLRVSAQLVDVVSKQAIFQDEFSVEYERLLTLHETVARRLISALNLNLSPAELQALRRDIPRHPLAWEYYLRGIDHLEAARLPLAMDALERSVKLDPQFSLAWTELGAAYVVNAALRFGGREMYDRAQTAFDRAIALNPTEPRPRVMLSDMFIETNRVEDAVSVLRTVLREHPHHAMALWQLSYAYRYAGMLDESAQAGQAAYEADLGFTPRSTVFNTWLYLGQYEKFRDTLPRRGGSAYQLFYHGFAEYYLKNLTKARADFDRAYELDPGMLQARVGKALSDLLARQRSEGLRLMRETARQLEQHGLNDAEGVYKVAQAFAVLGDNASALRWLRASISGGFFCYPYLKTDPLLDNVRQLPGFRAALDQARQRHEAFKRRFF